MKFILLSQPPGLREVLARGEEQKGAVQEAKGLKILAQENRAANRRITAGDGGLSADLTNGQTLRPEKVSPKVASISSFLQEAATEKGARKAEAKRSPQWLPPPSSDP